MNQQKRRLKGEDKIGQIVVRIETLSFLKLLKFKYSLKTYDDAIHFLRNKVKGNVLKGG